MPDDSHNDWGPGQPNRADRPPADDSFYESIFRSDSSRVPSEPDAAGTTRPSHTSHVPEPLTDAASGGRAAPASETPEEPDEHESSRLPVAIGLLAALLVILLVVGWYLLYGPGRNPQAATSAPMITSSGTPFARTPAGVPSLSRATSTAPTPRPTGRLAATSVPTPTPTARTATSVPADPKGHAVTELGRQAAADRRGLTVDNQYVAQLASKWVGISDPLQTTASGGHTFGAQDILAEHRALRDRIKNAEVRLLDSTTYGARRSRDGEPYWVTVALSPSFTSAESVDRWCAAAFPDRSGQELKNSCLPTRLTIRA